MGSSHFFACDCAVAFGSKLAVAQAWGTRYLVADGKLSCVSDGVEVAFPLSSLVSVSEDDSRLEISFGGNELCVIPEHAFESVEFKVAFIHAIKIRVAGF